MGPPKTQIETQNWCQFLSPSCLPRDAISKYIKTDILARMRQASRQASRPRGRPRGYGNCSAAKEGLGEDEGRLEAGLHIHTYRHSVTHEQKPLTLLDLCVSSLRRGHANLLCIVPILSDDPRRGNPLGSE